MSGPKLAPPELPGFTLIRWLGGGGFADVFLYRQHRPAREVAVKVLRQGAVEQTARQAFDAEADLMAQVSAHTYIVTVHAADVAPDGRPYLVMEYYSRPHLGQRSAEKSLKVGDALRIGVQVASAVETAHRAGILHRDIKPANILVNGYDRPGLTDFGIAGLRTTDGESVQAVAASLPFAAPEVVSGAEGPVGIAADIWSLAATVHTLLAGRSPFERPSITRHELLARILTREPNELARTDLPRSLTLLLKQGLNKDPEQRPLSALAFAHALQDVERQLHLAPTQIELLSDELDLTGPIEDLGEDDGTIRVPQRVIDLRADSPRGGSAGRAVRTSMYEAGSRPNAGGTRALTGVSRSMNRAARGDVPTQAEPPSVSMSPLPSVVQPVSTAALPGEFHRELGDGRRRVGPRRLLLASIAGLLILAGGILALTLSKSSGSPSTNSSPSSPAPTFNLAPNAPSDVTVVRVGKDIRVSWKDTNFQPGDSYLVTPVGGTAVNVVGARSKDFPATADRQSCFTVSKVRNSEPSADVPECL